MNKSIELLRRYWLVLLFLIIVLIGVGGYAYGYRISSSGIVRTGTLVLTEVGAGARVYTDQSRLTLSVGGETRIELTPGTHTVIVDSPGMQPWNELFEIESGKETILAPLSIPVEVTARVLHGEERATAADAILAYLLPQKTAPLTLSGGCALVYVFENRVVADGTTTPSCVPPVFLECAAEIASSGACPSTVIFPPNERLESVSKYPGRDDALVIAAGGQAYVVELDPRTPQFFAPILKGPRVRSAPWTDTSIVISDTKKVFELPL